MSNPRPEDLPSFSTPPPITEIAHDGSLQSANRIRQAVQGVRGIELINITDPAADPEGLVRIAYHLEDESGAHRRARFIFPGDRIRIQDGRAGILRGDQSVDRQLAGELIEKTLQRAEGRPAHQISDDLALAVRLAGVLDTLLRR